MSKKTKKTRTSRDPVTTQAALLQALIDGPAFGLELVERIREATGSRMVIGQGSLYPNLWGLEEEGLVTSYQGEPMPERGGRPRKYYELTADGLRKARDEREAILSLFGVREVIP